MGFSEYKGLVDQIKIGKQLPDSVYVHNSSLSGVPAKLAAITIKIADLLKIPDDAWNIVKFNKRDFKLSLLSYPAFDSYAYPALNNSFTIDLAKLSVREASYKDSTNPPILHRKETFVADDYPLIEEFCAITAEGESIGLYENTRTIGFKQSWDRLISRKGYVLDDIGRLQPKAAAQPSLAPDLDTPAKIARHKTAIDRNQLSAPMQLLARHGYLSGDRSILDYGCGKGDDLTELEAHGIDCTGWDPAHRPDVDLISSDIVNLGFVLNVIEDKTERDLTLQRAWEYADQLLIVSVMVAGESIIRQFEPYKDGIITSINTFQKYYSQSEIRSYLETTLGQSAIAVGQGIFILFKDQLEEQIFLLERQHVTRDWKQLTQRERRSASKDISTEVIDKHQALFDDFWSATLDLGRIPANSEFEYSEQLRRVAGSHLKAFQALNEQYGGSLFLEAEEARQNDLLVYFALGLFEKRQAYSQMPDSLKRDIKSFFQSITDAQEQARDILFSVGKPEVIQAACIAAHAQIQCGEYTDGHSFTFHKDFLSSLPPVLRIYIGCAIQLYGDIEEMQLIKAHIRSGKVSLMRYKDWEKETPLLIERIKIKLREQDIDFFDYVGEYEPTPLLNKNIFK
jgi:DNA phosphorothioation-associated putative methyltransferase